MSMTRRSSAGRRRPARTASLLAAASLAILAACGGGSSPTATGPGSGPSTSTSAPAPAPTGVVATTVAPGPGGGIPTTTPPTPATTPPTTAAPDRLTNASRLRLDGIGPVKVGMTLSEASAAAHTPIGLRGNQLDGDCKYAAPEGGPSGLAFMLEGGRIVRIDVSSWPPEGGPSPVATLSGAHIGSRESEVMAMYPGRIEVSRAPYDEKGHYLTYRPTDAASRQYGLIFETDGQKVTSFRAGRTGPVGYIEGCA